MGGSSGFKEPTESDPAAKKAKGAFGGKGKNDMTSYAKSGSSGGTGSGDVGSQAQKGPSGGGPLDQQSAQAAIIRVLSNMMTKKGSQQDELPSPPNKPVTTQFESIRRQIALNNPGAQGGITYVREF